MYKFIGIIKADYRYEYEPLPDNARLMVDRSKTIAIIAGFLGIAVGIFIQLILVSSLQSFGVSFLSPYVPSSNKDGNSTFFIKPIFKREKRSNFLNTKKPDQEAEISMKWKGKQ